MSSIAEVKSYIGRSEIRTEIIRKSIHMMVALVPLLAARNLEVTLFLLAGGTLFYTWAETQRVNGRSVVLVSFLTNAAARRKDRDGIVFGPITLGIGAMIALLLYPQPAAAMAIYALAFGDGFSGLFGKLFGRIEIPYTGGKTIAGSFACYSAVLVAAVSVLPNPYAAMKVAVAATLLEMLPTGDLDNIILPVGVGMLTWYLMI